VENDRKAVFLIGLIDILQLSEKLVERVLFPGSLEVRGSLDPALIVELEP
jgi:hypothetical protein